MFNSITMQDKLHGSYNKECILSKTEWENNNAKFHKDLLLTLCLKTTMGSS